MILQGEVLAHAWLVRCCRIGGILRSYRIEPYLFFMDRVNHRLYKGSNYG